MRIGIIGMGVVGGAMYRGFANAGCEVRGHDADPACSRDGLDETLAQDVVLIAVPTPVDAANRCDLSAIHAVLERAAALNAPGLFVVRSTIPVGTTRALMGLHPNLRIGHSPEFLRSATADADFLNPPMTVYGGADAATYFAAIRRACKTIEHKCIELAPGEAELVKLLLNGFAAVKAVFSSEMARLARESGADWDKVVAAAKLEGRLGEGYLSAAGPDGLPGAGGHCLPKDCRMLASQLGPGSLIEAVLEINAKLRGEIATGRG
ncbi:MAG TPA: NAD(P)-binding domain-containing protein [Chthoniobacteraceae bacterium]|nr:NAD(P)-binding domain-containing protein [Chthoniobacteraceae bacterium]